jgi:hypothetical protein
VLLMSKHIKRTEKHEEARRLLPQELMPIFDELVADYKFYSTMHHGAAFQRPDP